MEFRNLDSGKLLVAALKRLLSTKRTTVDQARVEDRFRRKLCNARRKAEPGSSVIVDCDKTNVGGRRGRCLCCYREFNSEMHRFGNDSEGAVEYECKLVRIGELLDNDETRQLNSTSLIRRRRRA